MAAGCCRAMRDLTVATEVDGGMVRVVAKEVMLVRYSNMKREHFEAAEVEETY